MTLTVTTTDLRDNLKLYLAAVMEGKVITITKRGKVIARLEPQVDLEEEERKAYEQRLKDYKKGSIIINQDIVNQPLKEYDYLDDTIYSNPSIAAEPDE